MPIKILFLLSNFRAGGAERQYFNLIHGINKQEFEVHIGLIQYRDSRPSTVVLESLQDMHVHLFTRKHRSDISIIPKIGRYAKNNGIDIIQSLLFMDNQIARLAGLFSRKLVVTSVRGEPLPLLGRAKTWIEYRAQVLSKKVVVNSTWLKEYLVIHGSCADKVVVIHNGTESANFRSDSDPRETRKKYGIPDDVPLIGIVARLHPMKDHFTFFDVIKIFKDTLPDVYAVVVGDGEMMDVLHAYVIKLGLERNVKFLGTVSKELPEIYRAMNVFLLTSQYGESFPNVILEAMSASVPVVATNISAVPEIIIEGENGFMVDKKDPGVMADRVLEILADSTLRDKFIRNGLSRVEEFGVIAMVKKYEQLYREIYHAV